mmetsp:Transcript_6248/g.15736  ORF Transcript_6248/g.15736 Transcript_6248/m.15736 type:complete len:209 (+) Transcript_6248:809-1435(+)
MMMHKKKARTTTVLTTAAAAAAVGPPRTTSSLVNDRSRDYTTRHCGCTNKHSRNHRRRKFTTRTKKVTVATKTEMIQAVKDKSIAGFRFGPQDSTTIHRLLYPMRYPVVVVADGTVNLMINMFRLRPLPTRRKDLQQDQTSEAERTLSLVRMIRILMPQAKEIEKVTARKIVVRVIGTLPPVEVTKVRMQMSGFLVARRYGSEVTSRI